ncbi:TetR/AcrR family transcriptional regulator [Agathobaculum sp. Marseille-P7918]|uniref:TetR/AcrR family transcriptional regulator n=1 Tax=Agathobaculum sp. Marseille-P7918 TaxID=2479843 RepID=UPI000F644374|nr:TetR/AcrR family transcriptional regulator [Agathobaculum sp. Marseille-P7918]
MARKGLSRDTIVDAAAALAEQKGMENLTVRELADALGVKPASLYNHLQGLPELNVRLAERALDRLMQTLEQVMDGRPVTDTLRALAAAYRTFAQEQPQLYRAMMLLPRFSDPGLVARKKAFMDLFVRMLEPLGLPARERVHLSRLIRSTLHGYVSMETAGFFRSPLATADESYERATEWLCEQIERTEANYHGGTIHQ